MMAINDLVTIVMETLKPVKCNRGNIEIEFQWILNLIKEIKTLFAVIIGC